MSITQPACICQHSRPVQTGAQTVLLTQVTCVTSTCRKEWLHNQMCTHKSQQQPTTGSTCSAKHSKSVGSARLLWHSRHWGPTQSHNPHKQTTRWWTSGCAEGQYLHGCSSRGEMPAQAHMQASHTLQEGSRCSVSKGRTTPCPDHRKL